MSNAARYIEVGELAGSTSIAMSVIDLSSVLVDINATEDMINKIKLGDKVEVIIKAAGDDKFEGKSQIFLLQQIPKLKAIW